MISKLKEILLKFRDQMRGQSGFTLIELMVVIVIVVILALAVVPFFKKTVEEAKFSEGITAIGAIQTKIKVYMAKEGKLPPLAISAAGVTFDTLTAVGSPLVGQAVLPSTIRFVGSAGEYYAMNNATPWGPASAIAAAAGKSYTQTALEIEYDEYAGKSFKNHHYQYCLVRQVDANGYYAYALAVSPSGYPTDSKARANACYAVFVRFCAETVGTVTPSVTATYADYMATDTGIIKVLDTSANGTLYVPAYNATDANIRTGTGDPVVKWEF